MWSTRFWSLCFFRFWIIFYKGWPFHCHARSVPVFPKFQIRVRINATDRLLECFVNRFHFSRVWCINRLVVRNPNVLKIKLYWIIFLIKWGAAFRWSFGPNSASGSKESTTIGRILLKLYLDKFLSGFLNFLWFLKNSNHWIFINWVVLTCFKVEDSFRNEKWLVDRLK